MRARIVRSRIARSAGAALAATALVALLAPPAPTLEARGGGSVAAVGEVARVRMRDNLFRPASITVQRGTRVRWVNRGENPHTTTSARGI